jgi:hypothetical protein
MKMREIMDLIVEASEEMPNPLHALTDDQLYDRLGDAIVAEEKARASFGKTGKIAAGERYRKARAKAGALKTELGRRGLPIHRSKG